MECKCDMRTKLIGDGCRKCNPDYWIDQLEIEVEELRVFVTVIQGAKDMSQIRRLLMQHGYGL